MLMRWFWVKALSSFRYPLLMGANGTILLPQKAAIRSCS